MDTSIKSKYDGVKKTTPRHCEEDKVRRGNLYWAFCELNIVLCQVAFMLLHIIKHVVFYTYCTVFSVVAVCCPPGVND